MDIFELVLFIILILLIITRLPGVLWPKKFKQSLKYLINNENIFYVYSIISIIIVLIILRYMYIPLIEILSIGLLFIILFKGIAWLMIPETKEVVKALLKRPDSYFRISSLITILFALFLLYLLS